MNIDAALYKRIISFGERLTNIAEYANEVQKLSNECANDCEEVLKGTENEDLSDWIGDVANEAWSLHDYIRDLDRIHREIVDTLKAGMAGGDAGA